MDTFTGEEVSTERVEEKQGQSRSHLRELFWLASSLFANAEIEVQGLTRKLLENKDINPEVRSELLDKLWQRQKEAKMVIEQWIDDRIRQVFRTFPNPFKKELQQLQKRVTCLGKRVERLSENVKGSGGYGS